MDQCLDVLYRGGCTRAVRRDEMGSCTGKASVQKEKKDINLGQTRRNSINSRLTLLPMYR
jgi:hypothetical protein